MKYLITGGCGFLGANISAQLLKNGDSVTIIDNLSRIGARDNLSWLESLGYFKFHELCVRDSGLLSEVIAFTRPDFIFHLAAQVAMTTSVHDPRKDFETNTLGTLNVLEAIRLMSPKTGLIYASTNKVYGSLSKYRCVSDENRYSLPEFNDGIDEGTHLDFQSPYGCSKGAGDQYVLDYARMFDLKAIVFRHSSIYGVRQFPTMDQGWVGWFCEKAVLQKIGSERHFTIAGDGKQVRDLLNVRDAVRLYLKSAREISSISGNAYNIGGGVINSLSIIELLAKLERMLDCKLFYSNDTARTSDQKYFVSSLRKIKTDVGWSPSVCIDRGLEEMLDWTWSRFQ